MRTCLVVLILLAVGAVLWAATSPAMAQAEYSDVSSVQAFSAQANFMSLPGYLRWITYRDQKVWLTYQEAARIVSTQKQK